MPSLQALQEFKTNFSQIGREDLANIAQNIPYDDLPLPDHEPSALPSAAETSSHGLTESLAGIPASSADSEIFTETSQDVPGGIPADDSSSADDDFFDFSDLGGLAGGNVDAEPLPDAALDDLDLGGLAGGVDAQPSPDSTFDDFDVGGLTGDEPETPSDLALDDLDLGGGADGVDSGPASGTAFDDFDLGDLPGFPGTESSDDTMSFDEQPDDALPADEFSTGGEELPEAAIDDFDLGDLPGLSAPETETADEGLGDDTSSALDDFSLDPGDMPDFTDASTGADEDFGAEDFPSEDGLQEDDFSLPEASDDLSETAFPLDEIPDDILPETSFETEDAGAESYTGDSDLSSEELPGVEDFNIDPGEMPDFSEASTGVDEDFGAEDFPSEDGLQEDDFSLPEVSDDLNVAEEDFPFEALGTADAETPSGDFPAEDDFPLSGESAGGAELPAQESPDEMFGDFSEDLGLGETSPFGESVDEIPLETAFDAEGSGAEDFPSGDLPEVEDFNLDLGGTPGFSDTSADTGEGFPVDEDFSDADFGADTDFDNLDTGFGDTDNLDAGGEDSFDQGLPDGGMGEDSFPGEDDFEAPGESFTVDDLSSEADSFDNFNLDKDVLPTDFNINVNRGLVDDEIDKDLTDLDEFHIPGIDDVVSGPDKRAAKTDSFSGDDGHVEVEEIRLNDNEFERLQETLLSYPLNLRIACGQIIVEEAVPPELMSSFVNLLKKGASARETAALAGKILGKSIAIPKGYEKRTGEAFEEEQGSFSYIFVYKFLPVFRLYLAIALVALSLGYLAWNFIYVPIKAEGIYKQGYERISAGEYNWANRRFQEAFDIRPKKDWFYRYAEAFRDERQYIEAEKKYQELMYFTGSKNKRGIPEKQAVLDYAALATYYMKDYQKADTLLRRNILDYVIWDKDALLALGDNSLVWGEIEPARLEDARESYAILLDRYGQSDPVFERMLKYFILTDNLKEVLPLQRYFMYSEKRPISALTLADLGGYLIDKRTQEVRGVPNEFRDNIEGIRDVLLRAVRTDQLHPESYYHLARYYEMMGSSTDEGYTLERGIQVFNLAKEETPRRLGYHIDAIRRYAEILIHRREFFPAEEQLIKGINLYENGISRRIINRTPEFGRLYAHLGDLEYFVKSGDMGAALDYYSRAERSGYSPPELRYRMGVAHYNLEQWPQALNRFVDASGDIPFNRRILHALGNVSYIRGNYHAAQAYYDRLLEILDTDRSRFPPIMPTENKEQLELAERLMVAQNNMGVVLEALTSRTGDNHYRSRALGLFAESERAWDVITRNPDTLVRMRPSPDITAPGINPAYLNVQNSLHPVPSYEPQFFLRIDRDILEPSQWEELAPPAFRLSQGIRSGLE